MATKLRIAGVRSSSQYRVRYAGQHQAQPGQVRVVDGALVADYDAIHPSWWAGLGDREVRFNFDSILTLAEVRQLLRDIQPLFVNLLDCDDDGVVDARCDIQGAIERAERASSDRRYVKWAVGRAW